MLRTLTIIFFILLSGRSIASELTAIELNQYCKELDKGAVGNEFDKELAEQCTGYMAGFFDSMIIVEKLMGKKEFCIPRVLPKAQNNLLLGAWINKNKEIAPKTTASVALYSAFKLAFPCD